MIYTKYILYLYYILLIYYIIYLLLYFYYYHSSTKYESVIPRPEVDDPDGGDDADHAEVDEKHQPPEYELDMGDGETNTALDSLVNSDRAVPSSAPDDLLLCGMVGPSDLESDPHPGPSSGQEPSSSSDIKADDNGDSGVVAAVTADAPMSSSNSSVVRQPLSRQLEDVCGFAVVLEGGEFGLNCGARVLLKAGVSESSTGTVASVYAANQDDNTILGHIGTAAPLGSSLGLKASCNRHSEGRHYRCQCWINFKKNDTVTDDARLNLFRTLCEWLAEGHTCTKEEHSNSSLTLRLAAGMNPRNRRVS